MSGKGNSMNVTYDPSYLGYNPYAVGGVNPYVPYAYP
jgi:hypothetical protein